MIRSLVTTNNHHYYYGRNIVINVIGWFLISIITSIVFVSSSSDVTSSSFHKLPLEGIQPDPFVVAAPIIIAAVCKDGVAIIAAHPQSPSGSNDDDDTIVDEATAIQMDPLLYYRPSKYNNNNNNDISTTEPDKDINDNLLLESTKNNIIDVSTEEDDGSIPFIDIPIDFGGPYRINNIGRISTDGIVVVSCGWRPDCQTILDYCETILDNEIQIHGRKVSVLSSYTNDYSFSNRLVNQLSYYKAQCAVSERVSFTYFLFPEFFYPFS